MASKKRGGGGGGEAKNGKKVFIGQDVCKNTTGRGRGRQALRRPLRCVCVCVWAIYICIAGLPNLQKD